MKAFIFVGSSTLSFTGACLDRTWLKHGCLSTVPTTTPFFDPLVIAACVLANVFAGSFEVQDCSNVALLNGL